MTIEQIREYPDNFMEVVKMHMQFLEDNYKAQENYIDVIVRMGHRGDLSVDESSALISSSRKIANYLRSEFEKMKYVNYNMPDAPKKEPKLREAAYRKQKYDPWRHY